MNAFVKISMILAITAQALTSCVSKTTCWKIINEGKCVPISTYKEWNKCVVVDLFHYECKSLMKEQVDSDSREEILSALRSEGVVPDL